MLRNLIAGAAFLGLSAPVFADKFYFGAPADAEKTQGNAAQYVEGVLLREENGNYVIRVEGGEITLAKSMVTKIEKDALTVADLEKREKAAAEKLAAANKTRKEWQAAEADAKRSEAQAAEATAAKQAPRAVDVVVDFQGLLPNYRFKTFDPVLDRVNLQGLQQVIEAYLWDEVNRAAHRNPSQERMNVR
jgi:hypothetical protein